MLGGTPPDVPRGERLAHAERLAVTRRHGDDETTDLPPFERFQMLGKEIEMGRALVVREEEREEVRQATTRKLLPRKRSDGFQRARRHPHAPGEFGAASRAEQVEHNEEGRNGMAIGGIVGVIVLIILIIILLRLV